MHKEIAVGACIECPFHSVEGMEHMMYCNHPYWHGEGSYAGAIITQSNRNKIPEKCPLKRGPYNESRTIRLK